MKSKKLIALALASVMSLSIVGCGSTEGSETAQASVAQSSAAATESTAVAATQEEHDPVTLRFMWWGGDARAEATLNVIDEFQKEYPWITIEAEYGSSDGYQEKLTAQLVAGTAPDIIQMGTGWMPGYVESNPDYFVDFKEYSNIIDLSTFAESFLENNGCFDGHQYGLPTGVSGHAFLYNSGLANQIGIDFSQDYTWDDLLEMGKKVKAYDDSMYLLTMGSSELNTMIVRPYLQQLTGNTVLVNDTKSLGFTEDNMVQLFTYIKSLYDNGVVVPIADVIAYGSDMITDPNWINQKYVAMFSYSSTVETATAACPDGSFAVGKLPVMNNAKDEGWYCNCPQYMCVYGGSENKEAAIMFLNYFYNNEKAAELLTTVRSVPPTSVGQSVCADLGLLEGVTKDSVDIIQSYSGTNDLGLTTEEEVTAILEDAATQIAYGQGTPEEVATKTMKLLESFLAGK